MLTTGIVADLHLHSKYSRAVSREMVIPTMAEWGRRKGIDLLATGDWMHSLWFRVLEAELVEVSEGIYQVESGKLRGEDSAKTKFLLSGEISLIYSQGGKGRRVHLLLLAPSFDIAGRINKELIRRGGNLGSDGRPIVGLSCRQLAEIVFSVSERCLVIPSHCWTPWFSIFGSKSGFDSIKECFGEYSERIYAVETGLSSSPEMNWRIRELERRAIISCSDAHSPAKLGREVTIFSGKSRSRSARQTFSYDDIYWAVAERFLGKNEGKLGIGYTIEFYPEEGKYHYTGHRNCQVVHSPEDTKKKGSTCPVCGRPLTVGVIHRVEQLAQGGITNKPTDSQGVTFVHHSTDPTRPPYVMLVPLMEILAEVHGVGPGTKKVQEDYLRLVSQFDGEFNVLLKAPVKELTRFGGQRLAEAITKVRKQDISVDPGYDGVFGTVKIWGEEDSEDKATPGQDQMSLF